MPRIIFRAVNCGYVDSFSFPLIIPLVGLPLPTANHFIIQLNRTLFEILPNKSRRSEFEICRPSTSSRLLVLFFFCLLLSQGEHSRLLSIFHSIKRMKRQRPIAEDLCHDAEAQEFQYVNKRTVCAAFLSYCNHHKSVLSSVSSLPCEGCHN
jgi:hypothetical protein